MLKNDQNHLDKERELECVIANLYEFGDGGEIFMTSCDYCYII